MVSPRTVIGPHHPKIPKIPGTQYLIHEGCRRHPHTRDVHYGYDLRNLQLHARFDSHTGPGITNTYDAFGRLASAAENSGGTSRTLSYQYDAAGNRTRITHPDEAFFVYEYDALSRFTGIDENGISDIASLSYHASGEPYVLGRGWAALGWLYDPLGRPTYQVVDLAGDASDASWTFQRNPASGIARVIRSNDAYAWQGHYAVSRAYQTNGLNQYGQAGGASFTYDANGNLIATPGPQPGQTITYTYDIENRLVAASTGVQLGYDPLGCLAWTTGSPSFTRFLYDGDALVAEYDYSGTLTERYVHGPAAGVDDPLFWYHGPEVAYPNRRQLFADPHGSIVAVTDVYGNRLAVNAYDEYGIPAATNTGRFQYTGQTWLAELGLYHYKARIYSPTLGRFLQTDPIGYDDQFNLYAYVGNDPVNMSDPDGTDALWIRYPNGTVTVVIPVHFTGSGATRTNIDRIVSTANSLRIDNSNFRVRVIETSRPIGGVLNRMELSPGGNRRVCGAQRECTYGNGGRWAYIDSSSNYRTGGGVHDILHFAGFLDRYIEGPPGPNGRGTAVPMPGYTNSNIMASRSGRELNGRQFDEARTNRSTRQCTVPVGSRIPICQR